MAKIINFPTKHTNCEFHITKAGEIIELHESWNGIYVGDYNCHVIFQKNISFNDGNHIYMSRKYSDLEDVMRRCTMSSKDGQILCEVNRGQYERRIKALQKLGYVVVKTTYKHDDEDHFMCHFVVEHA